MVSPGQTGSGLPSRRGGLNWITTRHGPVAGSRVLISNALGRWGSCNSRREVRLSWRLLKARPEVIDYVVCHELAHLRHMDHSKSFWREVEHMCPGYLALRSELDRADHLYRAF